MLPLTSDCERAILNMDAGCRANREGLDRMFLDHIERPTLRNLGGARVPEPGTIPGGILPLNQRRT